MFGSIGVPELLMIFVIALILFGPRKLPDIGRSLGKAMGEFRKASNDLKRSLEEEVAAEDLKQLGKETREATTAAYQDIADAATGAVKKDEGPDLAGQHAAGEAPAAEKEGPTTH
jgi:TatA/E family protein of Tat protein translocase